MPDTTGGKKHEIGVKMIFGKTELKVRALNKRTGEETNAKFDPNFYRHSGLVRPYWYVYLFPELLIYSNSLVYLHVFVKTILA
jgi:hypothetical protein